MGDVGTVFSFRNSIYFLRHEVYTFSGLVKYILLQILDQVLLQILNQVLP